MPTIPLGADLPGSTPAPGERTELVPGVTRLTAPNASALTCTGTNTYLIGDSRLCVIDPGPDDPAHLDTLSRVIAGRKVDAIVVTHAHADHSGLSPALARLTGAPVLARGAALAGRSALMERLAARGLDSLGEGADASFHPDRDLSEGETIQVEGGQLEVLYTPGHFSNHICLGWNGFLFSGDHVMGWATSIVSPPDGDMADYMASLMRLARRPWSGLLPGHGAVVMDGAARIAELVAHRRAREAAVLAALDTHPRELPDITARAYGDLSHALLPFAARSCLAHLLDLWTRDLVETEDTTTPTRYHRKA